MTLETHSKRRSSVVVGALVALAVAAFLFIQQLVGVASSTLVGFSLDDVASGYFGAMWQQLLGYGLLILLVFSGGVFLSLWLLAPITPTLSLKHALVRGLLATAIGAALVLLLSLGHNLIGPMSGAGPLFGYGFPWPDPGRAIQAATMALQTGIGALVRQTPVVLLVVVLAWLWLQRRPSPSGVSTASAKV